MGICSSDHSPHLAEIKKFFREHSDYFREEGKGFRLKKFREEGKADDFGLKKLDIDDKLKSVVSQYENKLIEFKSK